MRMVEDAHGLQPRRYYYLRFLTDSFLVFSFMLLSVRVLRDFRSGGDPWKQGDWLINNAGGQIRRGPFGSLLISVSDILKIDPLQFVVVLQVLLLALLYLSFRYLCRKVNDPVIEILIIVSPAIFTVMWVADPQGSMRKELVAFLALSWVAIGLIDGQKILYWLGVVLFCASFVGHEAMVLFTPVFLLVLLFFNFSLSARETIASMLIVCFSALGSVYYAIKYTSLLRTEEVCRALTVRGIDQSLCDGAIAWLVYDSSYGFVNNESWFSTLSISIFLFTYFLAFMPYAFLLLCSKRPVYQLLLFIGLAVPFLPLYVVATDWGRWMSFHIFSVSVVLVCAMVAEKIRVVHRPGIFLVVCFVIIALAYSPNHKVAVQFGGVLRQIGFEIYWRFG